MEVVFLHLVCFTNYREGLMFARGCYSHGEPTIEQHIRLVCDCLSKKCGPMKETIVPIALLQGAINEELSHR
jgi:hypothetical protein